MKLWHSIFSRWRSESYCIIEEHEALLDLARDAAVQAVAFSKLLERELSTLNSVDDAQKAQLVQQAKQIEAEIARLKITILALADKLRSMRQSSVLEAAKLEWHDTNQMLAELLSEEPTNLQPPRGAS